MRERETRDQGSSLLGNPLNIINTTNNKKVARLFRTKTRANFTTSFPTFRTPMLEKIDSNAWDAFRNWRCWQVRDLSLLSPKFM